MKEQFIYKRDNLIMRINAVKKYPIKQIDMALNKLVNDQNEYIFMPQRFQFHTKMSPSIHSITC